MLTLHGYWRSSAAYRVRIALNLKGLDYTQVMHDLRTGDQSTPSYSAINPQQLVPALDDGAHVLTQSLAILEWLEETTPTPALLPTSPADRAIVRAMAMAIACEIHPLQNTRVQTYLRNDLRTTESQVSAWVSHWMHLTLEVLESQIARHGDGFCFGSAPTFADCCLVPQVYAARRFNVDLAAYPLIRAVDDTCAKLPAFVRAHPLAQPDADPPVDTIA